jgi:hypothetical protein
MAYKRDTGVQIWRQERRSQLRQESQQSRIVAPPRLEFIVLKIVNTPADYKLERKDLLEYDTGAILPTDLARANS